MKKLITLWIGLSLVLSMLSAQEWQHVYTNDENGQTLEGNLQNLKDAIYDGASVRIAWWHHRSGEDHPRVYHLADASFLTIQKDSIVYAQIRPIYGQVPDFNTYKMTLKENLEWNFIGGTNGQMDAMTRNVITGVIVSHTFRKSSFRWYVKP